MYDSAVPQGRASMVNYPRMQPRQTVVAVPTQGADCVYDWTAALDKHTVPVPLFKNSPTREQRCKVGYAPPPSSAGASCFDPNKLMPSTHSPHVAVVDMSKLSSRPEGSRSPIPQYKHQLNGDGRVVSAIGDLSCSPVRGSAPFVPNLAKMSKRAICESTEKRRHNPRFG
eukprot:TRINITY_DN18823_c0_g1_i1.p1 TRINITY_DN18823_c0_g1~~TRINITY_DN18823_c0_g1_i1.p1  ORF type:complete len:170 (+),score=27.29 TRINITY_DN18823_c0_g1_i1:270-779(+)